MRKIKIEIELYNDREIVNELEHIAQLIMSEYTSGQGWEITGKEEAETRDPIEEIKKEAEFPINFNEE